MAEHASRAARSIAFLFGRYQPLETVQAEERLDNLVGLAPDRRRIYFRYDPGFQKIRPVSTADLCASGYHRRDRMGGLCWLAAGAIEKQSHLPANFTTICFDPGGRRSGPSGGITKHISLLFLLLQPFDGRQPKSATGDADRLGRGIGRGCALLEHQEVSCRFTCDFLEFPWQFLVFIQR